MVKVKARVEKNIFEKEYFNYIKNYFYNHEVVKQDKYHFYGSKRIDSFSDPVLKEALEVLKDKAKELFISDTLVPTYAVFSEYSGKQAYLDKHLDRGPCTYTVDLCLYQETPWPIFVEGEEYNFYDNEALIFYANDQYHWRPEFPNPDINKVGIILFHYVEPDHKWLTLSENAKKILRERVKPI